MNNTHIDGLELKNTCRHESLFVEFDKPKTANKIIEGERYSFIDNEGKEESGVCVDYNETTGRVKLKLK